MISLTGENSIVFSAWKKTLDRVSGLLQSRGIEYKVIDGSLSLTKRREHLQEFKSPLGPNVLLMTLGTGAVGYVDWGADVDIKGFAHLANYECSLNLAIATRVYLLEPQWNPSIELQAFGRVLRLGQTQEVKIRRYIVKRTIEDVRSPVSLNLREDMMICANLYQRVIFYHDSEVNCDWLGADSDRRMKPWTHLK